MTDKISMSTTPFDSGEDEKKETKPKKDALDAFFDNTNYQWEEVTLPSRGMYYGGNPWSKVGLPGGVIEVRPWTINEEKILNTTRFVKSHKALDMIFEKTTRFPDDFKADDLLIGDRAFLLFYFRGISYGNIYEFSVKCTNEDCAITSSHEYDLNNMVGTIVPANESIGNEPFDVLLPDASRRAGGDIKVQVRFSRQFDVKSMLRTQNQKKVVGMRDSGLADDSLAQELMQNIVSVNGKSDQVVIRKFVNYMSALDASVIREFLKKHTPRIGTEIEVTCPHCDNEMRLELPITENFFRYTGATSNRKNVGGFSS